MQGQLGLNWVQGQLGLHWVHSMAVIKGCSQVANCPPSPIQLPTLADGSAAHAAASTTPDPAQGDRPPLQPTNVVPLLVTDQVLEETRRELVELWEKITAAAVSGRWPTTTGPLCDWCHFKNNETNPCPAFA